MLLTINEFHEKKGSKIQISLNGLNYFIPAITTFLHRLNYTRYWKFTPTAVKKI